MSLTNEEWDLVVKTATDFKSERWGYEDPETGKLHLWPAAVVAQSRGAKLITGQAFGPPHRRLQPATNKDESMLNKALQDVSDEFDTTGGRYLEQLDFWGEKILDRNPRKENEWK